MTKFKPQALTSRDCKFRFYENKSRAFPDYKYILSVNFNSAPVIQINIKKINKELYQFRVVHSSEQYPINDELACAVLNSLIANLSLTTDGNQFKVCLDENILFSESILSVKGFLKKGKKIELTVSNNQELIRAKRLLYESAKKEYSCGRGFLIDISSYWKDVYLVNEEYNSVAWGFSAWASHQDIAADEAEVIRKYVSGDVCEIGAGTGRVSLHLLPFSRSIVLTDYVAEVVQMLNEKFNQYNQVRVEKDDIVKNSERKSVFDCVCFFENGLGNILNFEDRKKAITNMYNLTNDGGVLIVSLRVFPEKSGDHLMIASIDPCFMGVYHTFSDTEIAKLFEGLKGSIEIINGLERPAGGFAKFVIFKKE